MIKNKEVKAGCTVHYVNEKLDDGSIIIQKPFFVKNQDNQQILKNKTQTIGV